LLRIAAFGIFFNAKIPPVWLCTAIQTTPKRPYPSFFPIAKSLIVGALLDLERVRSRMGSRVSVEAKDF
jgi:hypothetical protein